MFDDVLFCLVFPGLLYFHPIQTPNSAALQAWSSFKMSVSHDATESSTEETLLNSVKNLTVQKEVRPVKRKLNTDAATFFSILRLSI